MITFLKDGKKIHETHVVSSLAPAVGALVKIQGESEPYFKVEKVVFIFNGGVDADVYVTLPNADGYTGPGTIGCGCLGVVHPDCPVHGKTSVA